MSDLPRAIVAALDDEALDALAAQLLPRLAARLNPPTRRPEGWLAPVAAAEYLGVSRKRIYDLTSQRALEPDGRDGRTPLYSRETLDAYARSGRR